MGRGWRNEIPWFRGRGTSLGVGLLYGAWPSRELLMTVEELMKVQRAEPFRPYEIIVADGTVVQVQHPEFVARSPTGRTITVYEPDGSSRILDMLLVTQIRLAEKTRRRKGKNGKK